MNGRPISSGTREILPDIDHRLPDVGPRDRHDILTRGDHLSDFCAHRGDDAGEVGLDLRIAELLDRLGQVGLCVRYRRVGAGARLLGIVQRLLCGGVAGDEGSLPLLRRPRSRQLRLGLRQLGLGRAYRKLKSRGIDDADGLSFADEVTNVDGTRRSDVPGRGTRDWSCTAAQQRPRRPCRPSGSAQGPSTARVARARALSPPADIQPAPARTQTLPAAIMARLFMTGLPHMSRPGQRSAACRHRSRRARPARDLP